jgi:hypothetical protein
MVGAVVFVPNRKFKRKYNRIFKKDPLAANTFLLLCELADENGQVQTSEEELAELMATRFNDPSENAFGEKK